MNMLRIRVRIRWAIRKFLLVLNTFGLGLLTFSSYIQDNWVYLPAEVKDLIPNSKYILMGFCFLNIILKYFLIKGK